MRFMTRLGAVVLAAGLAMPAVAQDSVSNNSGLPGDAVSPWDTSEQLNEFVVDLTAFQTSAGADFGIAPILKYSKSSTGFFSSLASSLTMSPLTLTGTQFITGNYAVWNDAGPGVNNDPNRNDAPTSTITPTGAAVWQGVAFAEFATTDANSSMNNIITGIVQFDPNDPGRLFVRRTVAATNDDDGDGASGSFGLGGVDTSGVAYFKGDNFRASAPQPPMLGENVMWVQSLSRNTAIVNDIGNSGAVTDAADGGATGFPLNNASTSRQYSPPAGLDSNVIGRPVAVGALRPPFGGTTPIEYYYEQAAGALTTTTAHRAGANDQRGTVHFTTRQLFPDTVGTAGLLMKPGASNDTTAMAVWGLNADGSVNGQTLVDTPATISDNSPTEPFTFAFAPEFTNYQSQVYDSGSTGQVAIGIDADGRALVAGPYTGLGFTANDPEGGIVVARFDPADPAGTLEWGIAAWNELGLSSNSGKGIFDNTGTQIGELALLSEVTGGAPQGPSFSSPTFDAAGNVWFLAAAQLYRGMGPDEETGEMDDDFDTVLLRGVYDATNFAWTLELVFEQGQVFFGQNSQRNYQIRFVNVADSNSTASSTIFSSSMNQTAFGGDPIGTYAADPSDPRNLGGLIVTAEIVYDVNQDGDFIKVTGTGGDPASLDQEYNVLLYIGALPANPCPTDLNGDGVTDGADLGLLLGNWGNPGASDLNGDGTTDGADLGLLLGAWGVCP